MDEQEREGLIAFLRTTRPKEELKLALNILLEFKSHETGAEWMAQPFDFWVKLEQFEDYLRLLTDTDIQEVSDTHAIEYYRKLSK